MWCDDWWIWVTLKIRGPFDLRTDSELRRYLNDASIRPFRWVQDISPCHRQPLPPMFRIGEVRQWIDHDPI